jgi:hypothetical protein
MTNGLNQCPKSEVKMKNLQLGAELFSAICLSAEYSASPVTRCQHPSVQHQQTCNAVPLSCLACFFTVWCSFFMVFHDIGVSLVAVACNMDITSSTAPVFMVEMLCVD